MEKIVTRAIGTIWAYGFLLTSLLQELSPQYNDKPVWTPIRRPQLLAVPAAVGKGVCLIWSLHFQLRFHQHVRHQPLSNDADNSNLREADTPPGGSNSAPPAPEMEIEPRLEPGLQPSQPETTLHCEPVESQPETTASLGDQVAEVAEAAETAIEPVKLADVENEV